MKPIVRPDKPEESGQPVVVMRPTRSVRPGDHPDRTALRLAIGVVATLGLICTVWLMGYLGFRLGFAPLIDVPNLQVPPGTGLVTGTLILINVPRVIILAGIAEPAWLMIGFAIIAVPAAGLGAARPRTPGGPWPSRMETAFSYAGAIGAALNTLVLVAWTASDRRTAQIDQLRVDPWETESWLADLTAVAGIDALALIAAGLWVVLVLRLPIPTWMRAMAGAASCFALVVVMVAMSMSNAAVVELQKSRSEVFLDDGSVDTRLVLGSTPDHLATFRLDQGIAVIELSEQPGTMTVIGRHSIVSMLEAEVARAERQNR